MHILKRSAIVPYSCQQMFELVNAIETYPEFLPWCAASHIKSQNETEVVAALDVQWKGIGKTFTTKNILYPYERIDIQLVNGPLSKLDGVWTFIKINDDACKILLDLEFEFTGHFVDKLFQPIFQHIANTLVEAFVKRAAFLYAKK